MKRDYDLIRDLLLFLESRPPCTPAQEFPLFGRDRNTVQEHLELILEAGLALGRLTPIVGGPAYPLIQRLTWSGHEFLALSRQTAWDKAKQRLQERGVDASFDLLLELLKAATRIPGAVVPG